MEPDLKPLHFVRSSRDDLRAFPEEVRYEIGFSLKLAQSGEKAPNAKPLAGFHGASVLEVIADHDGSTYRCVYTIRFVPAIYVLHAFQKKSKKGIKTPAKDVALVRSRLKDAEKHHRETYQGQQRAKGAPTETARRH